MECLVCSRPNPPEAYYCQTCELPLGRVCPHCDAQSPPGAHTCVACNRSLEETSPPIYSPSVEKPTTVPNTPASFSNGRYQVKRMLGQGSKKRVYLARDTLLDRDIAFALIKTEGDEASAARILREAQAMGRLSAHPNIVTVFDLGEHDGQPFLVTELMAAGDLGTLIENAPDHRIPLGQAMDITRAVCLGLEFAHSHGIVHRDLKPGNVWLAPDGTAKIGDFGLAVTVDCPRLTREGMMVGTLYYMPPEQTSGRGVTAQSDLYSLGAMLYELVTGTPPFRGDDAVTIIGQHVNNAPLPPAWHNPSCPQPLEDLIVRLMEKSPSERPESAAQVAVALNAISSTLNTAEPSPFDPRGSIEQIALTVTTERPDLSGRTAPDGTVTILFSDIEASTSITERLGDLRWQEVLHTHNAIIRSQVATHGGFEVKSLGDGFMLAFSSARRGLQCAMAIQRSFASYSDGHPDPPIRVRIGLHAGEVIREVDDFFGKNVILASRIAAQAEGGQILASSLLKELAESAGDIRFGEAHDVKLKGLNGTTQVYPVIWDQTDQLNVSVGPAPRRPSLKGTVDRAGRSRLGRAVIGLAALTGVVAVGLWISGAISGPATQPDAGLLSVFPGSMTRSVSPDGDATVAGPADSVKSPVSAAITPTLVPNLGGLASPGAIAPTHSPDLGGLAFPGTIAPTLTPNLIGFASGEVITVSYQSALYPRSAPSGNIWEPGEILYQPKWWFDASSPVRYLATTANPLDARGGPPPFSSAIGPSGSYTYEWLPDRSLRLSPEGSLMVDSGLRLERNVTPSTMQPGVNQVSIQVVAEFLRPPTVNGSLVRPVGGILRAKLSDRGASDIYLGA